MVLSRSVNEPLPIAPVSLPLLVVSLGIPELDERDAVLHVLGPDLHHFGDGERVHSLQALLLSLNRQLRTLLQLAKENIFETIEN